MPLELSASVRNTVVAHATSATSNWRLCMPFLELRKGRMYLLRGGNMSGKSTLLRCLAGQHPRSNVTRLIGTEEAHFDVGTSVLSATDDPMFLEWSISDNVRVAAGDRSPARFEFSESLENFLEMLNDRYGWAIRPSDPLYTCSTGARAFVQLARAQIHCPPLYLIDEVTANLDDAKSEHFIDLLVRLVEHSSMTVVLVSHSERDQVLVETKAAGGRFGGRLTLTEGRNGETVCLQDPPS